MFEFRPEFAFWVDPEFGLEDGLELGMFASLTDLEVRPPKFRLLSWLSPLKGPRVALFGVFMLFIGDSALGRLGDSTDAFCESSKKFKSGASSQFDKSKGITDGVITLFPRPCPCPCPSL